MLGSLQWDSYSLSMCVWGCLVRWIRTGWAIDVGPSEVAGHLWYPDPAPVCAIKVEGNINIVICQDL